MRVLLALIFGILLLGGGMTSNAQCGVFPYEYETRKFENGLTLYMLPMESPGLVSYFSIVRTGSRDEYEPGHSGFAHLFEHMMFRGTKNYPGDVYDEMITRLGADGNAYTTDDYTCYYMTFSADGLDRVAMLESDRFRNLEYSEEVFQTETGAVYGEYRKGRTSPWSVMFEEIQDLAFDVHTYQHTTIGFEEDIKAMPTMYEYSQSFFDRYYRPENVILLIVGDIEIAKTEEIIRKYYSDWEPGYTPPKVNSEPTQEGERTESVEYSGRTLPILDVAYKGPEFDPQEKDHAALALLGDLAFGENSDLYKRLVIQEQKVQFIAPEFSKNRDPSLLHIISMIKTEEDIGYVRDLIYETLDTYKTEPVDPETLAELQSRRKYSFLMDLDTPSNVAHGLARYLAVTGEIATVDSYYTRLASVTPGDIQQVARKYFVEASRNVVTLKGAKR